MLKATAIPVLFALLAFVCPFCADAKVSSGKILLTGENSVGFLTKFAVSANVEGSLGVELIIPADTGMYTDERSLRLSLYNKDRSAWQKITKKNTLCKDKVKYSKKRIPIIFNVETRKIANGEKKSYWVASVSTQLEASKEDMYWYVAIDDCSLEQVYHSIKDAPEMEYKYTILNGGLHHSADELGMNKLHFVQIILSSTLLLWVSIKIGRAVFSSKQVHIALLVIGAAILCDILSGISELLHSSIYSVNGFGSYSFDCLASHFEAQCDALVALVLLLVGAGWTLPGDIVVKDGNNLSMLGSHSFLQKTVAGFSKPVSLIKSRNPAAIMIYLLLLSHAGLAQWGRTFDDEFDTYHSLEHLPGKVLMWIRFLFGFIFLLASSSVRNSGRCPYALQRFFQKFQIVGVGWFCALPFVAWYTSTMMHPHQKHFFLATGAALVQSISLCSLVWLMTADVDASPYHKLSTLQVANSSSIALSSSGLGNAGGSNVFKLGKTKICMD